MNATPEEIPPAFPFAEPQAPGLAPMAVTGRPLAALRRALPRLVAVWRRARRRNLAGGRRRAEHGSGAGRRRLAPARPDITPLAAARQRGRLSRARNRSAGDQARRPPGPAIASGYRPGYCTWVRTRRGSSATTSPCRWTRVATDPCRRTRWWDGRGSDTRHGAGSDASAAERDPARPSRTNP